MSRRDYYVVLGVARDADTGELKRAYRALALRFHPDQNPDNPEAEASFKEVSEAYTVLSDPEKRARYDRFGFESGPGGVDIKSFTELFEGLFGDLFGKRRNRAAGRDLRYTLELTFEEAALGVTKTIEFSGQEACSACDGSGASDEPGAQSTCDACGGRGEVKVQQGFFTASKVCGKCGGEGRLIRSQCAVCKGSGLEQRQRSFDVSIPADAEDGATKRVPGQGEPGRRGGPRGDLTVVVRVAPHPVFRREGGVVVCDVPVSIVDAALGAVVDVPTVDGRVEMRVPAGTQSGAVFRLRGRGAGAPGARGDAHVRVLVETPVELTDAQRQALAELRAGLTPTQQPLKRAFAEKTAAKPAK